MDDAVEILCERTSRKERESCLYLLMAPCAVDNEYVEEELGSDSEKETVETVAPVVPENKLSKEKQMELERKKLEQAKLQRQLKMQKM